MSFWVTKLGDYPLTNSSKMECFNMTGNLFLFIKKISKRLQYTIIVTQTYHTLFCNVQYMLPMVTFHSHTISIYNVISKTAIIKHSFSVKPI